ncbi:hypothetical protein [Selenomonas sp. KH1T6]
MTVCFLIIIFNDNDMSIAEVHGGMYKGFRDHGRAGSRGYHEGYGGIF